MTSISIENQPQTSAEMRFSVLTIAIRKQKRIKGGLGPVRLVRIPFTCLQLKWYHKILQLVFVSAGNLHRGINIAFQAIHWRPNMLFDLKQLVDA